MKRKWSIGRDNGGWLTGWWVRDIMELLDDLAETNAFLHSKATRAKLPETRPLPKFWNGRTVGHTEPDPADETNPDIYHLYPMEET